MHKIDADGNIAGEFSDGDEGLGILGTKVDAAWLNAVQTEIVNLLLDMGVVLAKGTNTQLRDAVRADLRLARAWGWVQINSGTITVSGFNVGAVALSVGNTSLVVELDMALNDADFCVLISDDGTTAGSSNTGAFGPMTNSKSKDGGTGGVAKFSVKYPSPGLADNDLSSGTWAFHFVVYGNRAA